MKKIIVVIIVVIILLFTCLYLQLSSISTSAHQLTEIKKNIVYQSPIDDSEED